MFGQMRLTSFPASPVLANVGWSRLAPNHGGGAFSHKISEAAKQRQLRHVLELIDVMKHNGLRADIFSYNVLISACGKEKYSRRAVQVFSEILQQALMPDVITYSALISACEKGTRHRQALIKAE